MVNTDHIHEAGSWRGVCRVQIDEQNSTFDIEEPFGGMATHQSAIAEATKISLGVSNTMELLETQLFDKPKSGFILVTFIRACKTCNTQLGSPVTVYLDIEQIQTVEMPKPWVILEHDLLTALHRKFLEAFQSELPLSDVRIV